MRIKSLFFAFGLSLLVLGGLSGCVASAGVGPDYGYYPPVRQPYYRPYPPRPVVVVPAPYYRRPVYRPAYPPAYRPAYRPRYDGYRGGPYGRRGR
ncbi:hypothetical protein [uncultured Hymenobacter sp.]|uniref:hypothetical protein n=1 Tax=uncultured Hymenobacter sp. TaxID=170016 RepID=UPI0035CC5B84